MSKKLPKNYEAVISAAREKHKNHEKIEVIRPMAARTVENWDKLSDTQQKTIKLLMPLYDDFVEVLRAIV